MTQSYEMQLLDGLAADLAAAGLGVWRPDGEYAPSERGITQHRLPEAPDEVIAIAWTNQDEIATYSRENETAITLFQVRSRVRNPDDGIDLHSQIRTRFHRVQGALSGHVVVGRVLSFAALGEDTNGRYLFSQNLSFTGLRARP